MIHSSPTLDLSSSIDHGCSDSECILEECKSRQKTRTISASRSTEEESDMCPRKRIACEVLVIFRDPDARPASCREREDLPSFWFKTKPSEDSMDPISPIEDIVRQQKNEQQAKGNIIIILSALIDPHGITREDLILPPDNVESFLDVCSCFHERVKRCKEMDGNAISSYNRRANRILELSRMFVAGACAHTVFYKSKEGDSYFCQQVFHPIDEKDKNITFMIRSDPFDGSQLTAVAEFMKGHCLQCKFVGELYVCGTCSKGNHFTRGINIDRSCRGNIEKYIQTCSECGKTGHKKGTCGKRRSNNLP